MDLFKLLKKPFFLLILSAFFSHCTKVKSTDIGTDLLPEIDNIFTFDTSLSVVTENILLGDSTLPFIGKDFQGRAEEHVLGRISDDPIFGKTEASIFMELKPPYYKYFFENVKDSLYLDSVVLCLKWNRTWGDTNAVQQVNVYELDQLLRPDSSYRTNSNFSYTKLLGSKTFAPRELDDSLYLFRQTLVNQLRIRLSNDWGKKLLEQDSAAGKPFSSDSLFRDFFKGFAIVPDAGGASSANALMGFSLSDTNTHLVLHYRYEKNGIMDTVKRKFSFDNVQLGGNANRVIRDLNGSEYQRQLQSGGSAGDSLVYVQTTPGSHTLIRIPSLAGFKAAKGNVIINLAELIMEQVPDAPGGRDLVFSVPDRLYLDYRDTLNHYQLPFLSDALTSGVYDPFVFGGTPKMATVNGRQVYRYSLFISRYVQGIITRNNPNYPLYLYAPYSVTYSNLLLGFNVNRLAKGRVRLGGGTHSTQRMRLRLVYTKI